jgi:tRNA pseudouridine38-40 synthase
MPKLVLWLEYDGSQFAGFQWQPDQATIQSEMEIAWYKLFQEKIRIIGSGRTDAGVHAEMQIVHFDTERILAARNIGLALNSRLPKTIRVKGLAFGPEDFHARYSAKERFYRYQIFIGQTALHYPYTWQISKMPDLKVLQSCARLVLGEHDFTTFCQIKAEVKHKRCIVWQSEWQQDGAQLFYRISANRFLHSMVRSLTGTMIEAGLGRWSADDFSRLLQMQRRVNGIFTAPAGGLFLERISYDPPIHWEWRSDYSRGEK